MKEIKLKKNVKLLIGDNIINPLTYVTISFTGGYSSEKKLELSHLTEHIFICFNYMIDGKVVSNPYMDNMHADARTEDDRVEFTFCVRDRLELHEKLEVLSHCFNDIVITDKELEREKITIIDELYQNGSSMEYIHKVERDFRTVTIEDVRRYIRENFSTDNLTITTIGRLDEQSIVDEMDELVSYLPTNNRKNTFNPDILDKWEAEGIRTQLGEKNSEELKLVFFTNNEVSTLRGKALFDLLALYLDNFRLGVKKRLRQEKRLAYRTHIWINDKREEMCYQIHCRQENIDEVIKETIAYFDEVCNKGVTEQDLELIKRDKLRNYEARPFHLLARVIRTISDKYLSTRDESTDVEIQQKILQDEEASVKKYNNERQQYVEKIEIIKSITADEMNEFIKKYFLGSRLVVKVNKEEKKI